MKPCAEKQTNLMHIVELYASAGTFMARNGGVSLSRGSGISVNLLDFTAIDFETANPNLHSACQLGLVVVRDGEIVERRAWMIRPPTERFDFTYIHGITWKMVAAEPDFGQLWPQIRPYLENNVIAAHNVPFDMGVFFALIKLYRVGFWRGSAIDSLTVSRRIWPWLSNHQLQTVAAHLCIPLEHHDAVSDANACAEIIRRAEREQAGVTEKAMRWYGGR